MVSGQTDLGFEVRAPNYPLGYIFLKTRFSLVPSHTPPLGVSGPTELIFEIPASNYPLGTIFLKTRFSLVGQTDRQTHKHFMVGEPFLSEKGTVLNLRKFRSYIRRIRSKGGSGGDE